MYRLVYIFLCVLGFQTMALGADGEWEGDSESVPPALADKLLPCERDLLSQLGAHKKSSQKGGPAQYGFMLITEEEFLKIKLNIKAVQWQESYRKTYEYRPKNLAEHELLILVNYFQWNNLFEDKNFLSNSELQLIGSSIVNYSKYFDRWYIIMTKLLQDIRPVVIHPWEEHPKPTYSQKLPYAFLQKPSFLRDGL